MRLMKEIAKRVFDIEIESLQYVADAIGDDFTNVVKAILNTAGKLVVIGIGKSGIIGKKISATFSSTGTPSLKISGSGCGAVFAYTLCGPPDKIIPTTPSTRSFAAGVAQ